MNRLLGAVLIGGLLALTGCGPEDTDGTPDGGPTDGTTVDGSADDGGADVTDSGIDTGEDPVDTGVDGSDGGGDADGGGMTGSSVPDSWTICGSTADCPIQGTTCLKQVSYNRPDHTGETSATIADLYDRVGDGQGICSQPCSDDPTVCDGIKWADASGQQVTARCHLLESGASPYDLAGTADFAEAMKKGAAFAAACLPPIAKSDERSGKVCQSCEDQSACGSDTACVNMKTETMRREADETGRSVCAARCQQTADCAVGFECVALGAGSTEGGMSGDAGTVDVGTGDAGRSDGGADDDSGMTDSGMADAGMADAGGSEGPGYCLPVSRTCDDCRDRDEDDRGTGHCGPAADRQTEVDCDDRKAKAYYDSEDMEHPWPGYCGSEDYNCDGVPDDQQLVGNQKFGEEHCAACGDTCSGMAGGGAVYQCVTDMETSSGYACIPDCPKGQSADCDGDPTNGCEVTLSGAKQNADQDKYLFYADADGDGFGADSTAQVFCSKADAKMKTGNDLVGKGGDCDDADADTHPGATEICDGKDNACEGGGASNVDEGCDDDNDGYCDADMGFKMAATNSTCTDGKGDCDDSDDRVYPGIAHEDSTTECMRDADDDGYGSVNAPSGGKSGTDCNDNRDKTYPGAAEKDSTTLCMKDGDEDGYGSATPPPNRPVQKGRDCDDTTSNIHPGESEDCNGVDDNCNGQIDEGNVVGDSGETAGKECHRQNVYGICDAGYEWQCDADTSNTDPTQNDDLTCVDVNSPSPKVEKPGFDGTDHSCDGVDRYAGTNGRKYHAVYVDAGRNASNSGKTPQSPTPDLTQAIKDARSASWCDGKSVAGESIPCDVYVSTRTNSMGSSILREYQHIYGGFDPTKWTGSNWKPGGANRTSKTTIQLAQPANGDVATFGAYNLFDDAGLSGLKFQAPDADEVGESSVAFFCEDCPGLWLEDVSFTAGKAGDGTDGQPAAYANKAYGGRVYAESCFEETPSGYDNLFHSGFTPTSNSGVGGGRHKRVNRDEGYYFFQTPGGTKERDGEDGRYLMSRADGGGPGKIDYSGGEVTFPADPADDGTFNDGGGGGGAADLFGVPNQIAGGSGGCPGHGGYKGTRGGHSVGLILIDSEGMHMNGVTATANSAGDGGDGGVGGEGGPGRAGQRIYDSTLNRYQESGAGGDGAGGDGGGGGAGGHSIGCLLLEHNIASGNFDQVQNCTGSTKGSGGSGGAGGSSPGRDGRKGNDGADGLSCGAYSIASWSDSSGHSFQSSCP